MVASLKEELAKQQALIHYEWEQATLDHENAARK